jgi:hypothetical protein
MRNRLVIIVATLMLTLLGATAKAETFTGDAICSKCMYHIVTCGGILVEPIDSNGFVSVGLHEWGCSFEKTSKVGTKILSVCPIGSYCSVKAIPKSFENEEDAGDGPVIASVLNVSIGEGGGGRNKLGHAIGIANRVMWNDETVD